MSNILWRLHQDYLVLMLGSDSKNSLTRFNVVRAGFACGREEMIHSSRVRTDCFVRGTLGDPFQVLFETKL